MRNLLPERNNIPKATQLVNYWCSDIVMILAQQTIVSIYPSMCKTQDEIDTFDYTTTWFGACMEFNAIYSTWDNEIVSYWSLGSCPGLSDFSDQWWTKAGKFQWMADYTAKSPSNDLTSVTWVTSLIFLFALYLPTSKVGTRVQDHSINQPPNTYWPLVYVRHHRNFGRNNTVQSKEQVTVNLSNMLIWVKSRAA